MATPNILAFEPDGRPIEFSVWLDDLQLFLLTDAKDGVSLFDYVSGSAVAPAPDAPALERSQWQTRDAAARLAIRNHLPITERAHFSQHRTAQTLYDAVVARYSSPTTAAIGRLMLPYLFPDLSSFTTAEDLVSHLCATDSRFRAALSAEGAPPPLSPPPTPPQLLFTTTLVLRGSELLPLPVGSVAVAGAAGVAGAVGVKVVEVVEVEAVVGVVVGVEAVEVVVGAAEALGAVRQQQRRLGRRERSGSGGQGLQQPQQQQQQHQRQRQTPTSKQLLDCDAWCAKFPDATEFPNWADLLRRDVPIFDLDYEAILAAMYALSVSAEGDCYLCVPPDPGTTPGIVPAALGACESTPLGTAPAQALHTFTLDSGASRCFFRDSTTVTPLPAPVPVSLADPSGGPVLARSSTVLPCPAVPSSELSGLHLPSFSTILVSNTVLQDAGVDTFTPSRQRVAICTCTQTGRHLATFARAPGSSLYTLTTASRSAPLSPQLHASARVATQ
ncbi:unnamed protein product [Closterium sp. NIES-53]